MLEVKTRETVQWMEIEIETRDLDLLLISGTLLQLRRNPFRTSRLEILSSEVKVVIEEGDRNSNSRELESKRKLLLKLERSLGEEEME